MKIAHASDLHGFFHVLGGVPTQPDLWVFTGDMLPNKTRGHILTETRYQMAWFGSVAHNVVRWLRGVPVLLVPGNHDYADLANLLRREGVDAQEVTPRGVSFQGATFAGFGHIPFIAGEWNREVTDRELSILTLKTLELGNPDVLLTHAPPGNILNGRYAGNGPLVTALTYHPHKVRVHLFGHAHEDGGQMVEAMDIKFYNSATTVQLVDL